MRACDTCRVSGHFGFRLRLSMIHDGKEGFAAQRFLCDQALPVHPPTAGLQRLLPDVLSLIRCLSEARSLRTCRKLSTQFDSLACSLFRSDCRARA